MEYVAVLGNPGRESHGRLEGGRELPALEECSYA